MALEESGPTTTVKTLKVKSGDSLGPMLQKNGLSGGQAYKVTQAFATVFKPRNLRVGNEFNLYFNGDTLENLTFKPNVEKTVFVDLKGDDYTAREVAAEFKYETIGVAAEISNSLYLDATRLGAPDRVVQQFANIYEYSVDFQRDIQPGDNFEMFFEVARDRKGKIIKSGDLLYTSFSPRAEKNQIIGFMLIARAVKISMMKKAKPQNGNYGPRLLMVRGCLHPMDAASIPSWATVKCMQALTLLPRAGHLSSQLALVRSSAPIVMVVLEIISAFATPMVTRQPMPI